jgi:hypothetical protein
LGGEAVYLVEGCQLVEVREVGLGTLLLRRGRGAVGFEVGEGRIYRLRLGVVHWMEG